MWSLSFPCSFWGKSGYLRNSFMGLHVLQQPGFLIILGYYPSVSIWKIIWISVVFAVIDESKFSPSFTQDSSNPPLINPVLIYIKSNDC